MTTKAPPTEGPDPQLGPQKLFLGVKADIAIYGGAAGGGKTWALLFEALRFVERSGFAATVFRRTTVQIRNPGGLWDESSKLFPGQGGKPFAAALEWRFPSGAKVKFAHLEHEKTSLEWQGAQLPMIGFDELGPFGGAVSAAGLDAIDAIASGLTSEVSALALQAKAQMASAAPATPAQPASGG